MIDDDGGGDDDGGDGDGGSDNMLRYQALAVVAQAKKLIIACVLVLLFICLEVSTTKIRYFSFD